MSENLERVLFNKLQLIPYLGNQFPDGHGTFHYYHYTYHHHKGSCRWLHITTPSFKSPARHTITTRLTHAMPAPRLNRHGKAQRDCFTIRGGGRVWRTRARERTAVCMCVMPQRRTVAELQLHFQHGKWPHSSRAGNHANRLLPTDRAHERTAIWRHVDQTTRRHIPDHRTLHSHGCETLRSNSLGNTGQVFIELHTREF